jgi:uncharacterized protein YoxC
MTAGRKKGMKHFPSFPAERKECKKKMQDIKKRTLLILLIAVFILSFVPVPESNGATITTITDEDGNPITGGVYDDTAIVFGAGVTAGVEVNLYWDAVRSWDGEKGLLNSEEANPDGSFEIEFDVPEAINGAHYLWIKDTDTGSIARSDVFTVDASLILTPKSGIPDDQITIKGYGFGDEVEIGPITFGTDSLTTSPSIPESDKLGSWDATFNVPDEDYDVYEIMAEDEDGNIGTFDFTIGPAITLDIEEGPVGTVVEVEGRGFTEDGIITSVTLDGISCSVLDNDDLEIDHKGEFVFECAIPQVSEAEEDYELRIEDSEDLEAAADFEVLGLAEIELTPSFGTPGSSIDIHGWNFTAIDGEEVVIYIGGTEAETLETDSDGEFSGSFTVPAIDTGNYDLTAEQGDYNIIASETFRVGFKIVILSETEGPTGMLVSLTGAGFSEGGQWDATFGDVTIFENEDVLSGGSISSVFYVPTLDPDTYEVTVLDIDEDMEVTEEFTITGKTEITLDPATAPVEYNVTIEGLYFAESDGDIEVEFVIYNSTDDWDMEVFMDSGDVSTGEDGDFTAWWLVPDVLSLGSYTVNATDDEGLYAQFAFSVASGEMSISPSKSMYYLGDTISFDIESTFEEEGSYIKIWDPESDLYWKTDDLNTWVKVGVVQVAPYFSQTAGGNLMTLTSDAPLGMWTWTWYDSDDDELGSGSFIVDKKTSGDISDEMLDELAEAIADLQEQTSGISDDIAQVRSDMADIESDIADLKSDIADLKSDVADANEAVSEIADNADEAKTAADEAKIAAEETKIAARGLTNLIYGAIGASLVSALVAAASLMQIIRMTSGKT